MTTPAPPSTSFDLDGFVARCLGASHAEDACAQLEALLGELLRSHSPAVLAEALAGYTDPSNLENLMFHRGETLTLMHGVLPPGFGAAPHNHNMWSVIAVYEGVEDNTFFERSDGGLAEVGRHSVVAPGILVNPPATIHSIQNGQTIPLRAIHAYGGDLLATPRSNWDAQTHVETPFDWRKVAKD